MTKPNGPVMVRVVTKNAELVEQLMALASSCEREGGFPCQIERVEHMESLSEANAHLVLLDLDSMTDTALEHIARLRQKGMRGSIVVVYEHPSPDRILNAMRSGSNDFLSMRPSKDEFTAVIRRAVDAAGLGASRPLGRVITVFSNKGGVGTTMLAINTAASLAAQRGGSVLVVDLALHHGDISAFLDVPITYTVANLATELDRADPSYLHSVLPKHSAGMYVLPAPYAPDEAELVTDTQVTRMLQKLRTAFDTIVVDAGNQFNDHTLSALDVSERVLLVSLPDLPSVRNTKRALELFERLRYDFAKLVLILNRCDAQERLRMEAMEEALGRKVLWSVPNDYVTVTRAINQGTSVRAIQPKGKLAANLDHLVGGHILGTAAASANGPSRQKGRGIRLLSGAK